MPSKKSALISQGQLIFVNDKLSMEFIEASALNSAEKSLRIDALKRGRDRWREQT